MMVIHYLGDLGVDTIEKHLQLRFGKVTVFNLLKTKE
jgi:hypothetical protein